MTVYGSVVDLFCGAGGLSHGFFLEDFNIAAGVDTDEDCRFPFERNNLAPFIRRDVRRLLGTEVDSWFLPGVPRILVGCAPCQPFSTYNQKNDDPKWQLLKEFGRLIEETLPDVVSMENVPRLAEFRNGLIFEEFGNLLLRLGYHVSSKIVFAPDYGVPQRRTRLVLLASRHGEIALTGTSVSAENYATVMNAIGHLPPLSAGGMDSVDPIHRSSSLSDKNFARIQAANPGGTWKDWPTELIADCHKASSGKSYGAVYGRMSWHEPSPTITTQFYGFGSGRFGHPEQDRALSLREGAILQTFPPDYEFVPPGKAVYFKKVGRMIGNAVPVELGRVIARSIASHLGGCVI